MEQQNTFDFASRRSPGRAPGLSSYQAAQIGSSQPGPIPTTFQSNLNLSLKDTLSQHTAAKSEVKVPIPQSSASLHSSVMSLKQQTEPPEATDDLISQSSAAPSNIHSLTNIDTISVSQVSESQAS